MKREEVIRELRFGHVLCSDKYLEAVIMAIQSLEAWDKVIKDATERTVTFIPKRLEENETYDSAFHDGVNYVIDIIEGYLGEVEE